MKALRSEACGLCSHRALFSLQSGQSPSHRPRKKLPARVLVTDMGIGYHRQELLDEAGWEEGNEARAQGCSFVCKQPPSARTSVGPLNRSGSATSENE